MLKRIPSVLLLGAALLSVSACGDIRETAGIKKKAPDEFAVVRRAPLSVPPNFDLRPPRPGERPVPQIDPRQEARTAVFGSSVTATPSLPADSAGEEALLRVLNVEPVDPDIRGQIDAESAVLASDQRNFVEQLMFWREPPPPGVAVDPQLENRRLQENDALGRPPTAGETPTIERKDTVRNRLF